MAAAAVRALEWAGVSEEQPRPGCSAPQTGTVRTTDISCFSSVKYVGSARLAESVRYVRRDGEARSSFPASRPSGGQRPHVLGRRVAHRGLAVRTSSRTRTFSLAISNSATASGDRSAYSKGAPPDAGVDRRRVRLRECASLA